MKKAIQSEKVADVSEVVRLEVDGRRCATPRDPFAKYSELNGFAVYASDGHSHSAASHEAPTGGNIRFTSKILISPFKFPFYSYRLVFLIISVVECFL